MSEPLTNGQLARVRSFAESNDAISSSCVIKLLNEIHRLSRRAEKVAWTTTLPTEPGWYRWRRSDVIAGRAVVPEVVLVEPLHHSMPKSLAVRRMDGYSGVLESAGGEWAGAVEFPEE